MTRKHSRSETGVITRTETLQSPALYLGDLEVTEDVGSYGRRFSGTWYKKFLVPLFYWFARHTPVFIAMIPVYLVLGLLRALYILPGNSFRQACEDICRLAAARGYHHQARRVFAQYLANVTTILNCYLLLLRYGADRVHERIDIRPADAEMVEKLRNEHGGVILNIPHNIGSAFSGMKLDRTWPTLLVARNSSTIERSKVQLAIFERMEVKVLMVRGGNPFELSRAMFSVLKKNKVVTATLDNIDNSDNRIEVTIFNHHIGFQPWAAKIAAKMKVPMVPVFFKSKGKQFQAVFGEPLITDNIEQAVQHYVSFFERCIYEDPASWSYLADRRWRRVLHSCSQALARQG